MCDEPPDHDEPLARLRAELEQRALEVQGLAEQLDRLQREIERLRQRITDEAE